MQEGRIRDTHGDLYLKNIFVTNAGEIYFYDRLEFNDSLRYADVVQDVAFLAMDLDFHNRRGLRKYFIRRYVEITKDLDTTKIVYFLMCHKACIRAMVSLFRSKNEKDPAKKKQQAVESKRLLALARSYFDYF